MKCLANYIARHFLQGVGKFDNFIFGKFGGISRLQVLLVTVS